jgi:hypothetical protein
MTTRSGRSGRSLPGGLIGMVVLVLAVEAAVSWHWRDLASYQAVGTRFAAEHATMSAPACAVLVLGDSQMKFGLDPTKFERKVGLSAFNLAVPGTPPALSQALLSRALDAGARPRAIVLGHMTLGGSPRDNLPVFSELLGPVESLELARTSQDFGLLAMVVTQRLLPSLRYRTALRASLLARFDDGRPHGGAGPGRRRALQLLHDWEAHRGAESVTADGRFDGRMEPHLEQRLFSQPWRVNPIHDSSVRRTLALAAAHDIAVFWVVAPIIPEAQARRDALGHDATHTRNLRAIFSKTPGAIVLDARHSDYPASAFFDSCHLNADGAAALTAAIARAVGDQLAHRRAIRTAQAPRWIELAPFDGPSDPIAAGRKSGPTSRR